MLLDVTEFWGKSLIAAELLAGGAGGARRGRGGGSRDGKAVLGGTQGGPDAATAVEFPGGQIQQHQRNLPGGEQDPPGDGPKRLLSSGGKAATYAYDRAFFPDGRSTRTPLYSRCESQEYAGVLGNAFGANSFRDPHDEPPVACDDRLECGIIGPCSATACGNSRCQQTDPQNSQSHTDKSNVTHDFTIPLFLRGAK
jgi:hypothetical protein